MNSKTYTLLILLVVSAAAAFLLLVSANLYSELQRLQTQQRYEEVARTPITSFRRVFTILSVDAAARHVVIESIDRPLGMEQLVLSTDEHTRISEQTPVVEGGIAVGMTPPQPIPLENLEPGMNGIAHIVLTEDGNFVANDIAIIGQTP